jgi:hypothetical protein
LRRERGKRRGKAAVSRQRRSRSQRAGDLRYALLHGGKVGLDIHFFWNIGTPCRLPQAPAPAAQ